MLVSRNFQINHIYALHLECQSSKTPKKSNFAKVKLEICQICLKMDLHVTHFLIFAEMTHVAVAEWSKASDHFRRSFG